MFKKNPLKKRWFMAATVVNLLLVMTIFLHVPVESYLGSADDFWFAFDAVAPMIFLVAAGVFVLLEVIDLLLPAKGIKLVTGFVFALSLCLYLQINFLNPNFGLLGAQFADNSGASTSVYTNLAFWVVMLLAIPIAVFLLRRKVVRQTLMAVSGLLIIMQAVSLVTLTAMNTEKLFMPGSGGTVITTDGMYTSGKEDGSILVFVMDTMDSQYFENALETDPELAEIFDGFTNFVNSTGSYTKTWGAVPYIISGVPNTNADTVTDYRARAYAETKLISTLEEAGYDTRIYTVESCVGDSLLQYLDNAGEQKVEITDPVTLYLNFMKYVGFRTLPEIVKPAMYIDGYGFRAIQAHVSDMNRYIQFDPSFYADLKQEGITAVDGKTFRLYHLWGPHDPYMMDENGNQAENTTAEQQMIGSLKILRDFFAGLKENGAYDNATILIIGDHSRYMNGESVFIVKKPYSTGAMVQSNAPVSHTDIHNTLFDLAGLPLTDYGESAFRIAEDSQRVRTGWLYRPELMWVYQPEYLPPMYEVQYGLDSLAPYYTGTVYVPGEGASTLAAVAKTVESGKTYGYTDLPELFVVDGLMTGDATQGYHYLNMRSGKVYFKLPDGHSGNVDVVMQFDSHMAVSPSRLAISCNGTTLFDETFADAMTDTVTVTVPAESIVDGMVVLDVSTPDAVMLDDHSVISFAIKGITVK